MSYQVTHAISLAPLLPHIRQKTVLGNLAAHIKGMLVGTGDGGGEIICPYIETAEAKPSISDFTVWAGHRSNQVGMRR